MSREDELRELLDETATEISRMSSNPRTWLSWLVYLLGRMESRATDENPSNKELYEDMLLALLDATRNRLKTGGW